MGAGRLTGSPPPGRVYGPARSDKDPKGRRWLYHLRFLPMLFRLYWKRARNQLVQEALAVLGIAIGVALIFAVEIANTSVPASVRSLYHELVGKASIEVAARSPEGFRQSLVAKVGEAPGVFGAAGVLESRITLIGPRGQAELTLFGAEPAIGAIGGPLVHRVSLRELETVAPSAGTEAAERLQGAHIPTIALPEGPARALGAAAGQLLTVDTRGRSVLVLCARVLGPNIAGAATESPVALAPLSSVQSITGLEHRLTRVMVKPQAGQEALARRSLAGVAGARLNVRSSESEVALLEEATRSEGQAAAVFTALALLVGLLFAYNAMLLTLPSRRRWISWLRDHGARRGDLIGLVVLEIAIIGLAAALLGLVLGDLLSGAVFGAVPRYLTSGFPVGAQRMITASALAIAAGGGLIATALAAGLPAIATLRKRPLEPPSDLKRAAHSLGAITGAVGVCIGLAAIVLAVVIALLAPSEGIAATIALVVALAFLLPSAVPWMIRRSERLALLLRSTSGYVATLELRAVPIRATAVAATAAVAVTAIVAIGGTATDIRRGVGKLIDDIYGGSAAFVSASSYAQTAFQVQPLAASTAATRVRSVAGVESVSQLREAFLDAGGHRLFVIAKPADDQVPVSATQIITGSQSLVAQRLRKDSGWLALSATVASDWHLSPGSTFVLPTPSGFVRFRLAATITNYGWPAGAIILNPTEYERLWHTSYATVLNVRLRHGMTQTQALDALRAALRGTGMMVSSRSEVQHDIEASTSQGMAQFLDLSTLVLIAAVLAVTAAMAGSIWQRRARLASLRRLGMRRGPLIRTIYLETGVVVAIGCVVGVIFGLGAQPIATAYIRNITGFPEVYFPNIWIAVRTLLLATLLSVVASGVLGYLVTRRSILWGSEA